ncbi:MAG TPA: O-antigen ligase family protein [Planctomycetaceae bacterium]|nr:O-antigen ligase family protein [Planctomycetaceae bacterium]
MSTTVAAIIATLMTSGMTSAVSHQFTMIGGSAAAVLLAGCALVRSNSQVYLAFLFGAIVLSVLALLSSESNTAQFSSTIHVLACYLAILALAVSSPDLSNFCQQLMMGNNVLLTAWVMYQANQANAFEAWSISNPSGAGNLMAAQINMTIPLVIARLQAARGQMKLAYAALLAANCVSVVLVMSRNGTGALLIILTIYVFFNYKRLAIILTASILTTALSLDTIMGIPAIHSLLVKFRIVGFVPVAPRSLIWQISLHHILKNPMLGVGPGQPKKLLAVLDINHAHNNFVQVAFETGIPSAVIFTILIGLLLWLPVRAVFGSRESFLPTLSILAYVSYSVTAGPLVFPGATLLLAACVNEARVTIQRGNLKTSRQAASLRTRTNSRGQPLVKAFANHPRAG